MCGGRGSDSTIGSARLRHSSLRLDSRLGATQTQLDTRVTQTHCRVTAVLWPSLDSPSPLSLESLPTPFQLTPHFLSTPGLTSLGFDSRRSARAGSGWPPRRATSPQRLVRTYHAYRTPYSCSSGMDLPYGIVTHRAPRCSGTSPTSTDNPPLETLL